MKHLLKFNESIEFNGLTVEEAAKQSISYEYGGEDVPTTDRRRSAFIEGAEWYNENTDKKYTEEDMKQFGLWLGNNLRKNKHKSIDDLFIEFEK